MLDMKGNTSEINSMRGSTMSLSSSNRLFYSILTIFFLYKILILEYH